MSRSSGASARSAASVTNGSVSQLGASRSVDRVRTVGRGRLGSHNQGNANRQSNVVAASGMAQSDCHNFRGAIMTRKTNRREFVQVAGLDASGLTWASGTLDASWVQ